ncbi:glycosyltransferase family 4 protein [Ruminiclostridium sufflavum]|nr:glycosyltransferase family 4 protein [Ruminiclostridium sufflavum]
MKREKDILLDLNYKVTLIEEPIYKNNVSLKRFYSHCTMAKNLKRYLKYRKRPNIIYCSVPSLDVAAAAAEYAKKNNIKFIIDIQDLWPEAFKMIFDFFVISDILFYRMKKKADYIYKSADEIVAVSKTYLKRALEVNSKVHEGKVVFLGTDLSKFDEAFINNKYRNKPENEVWIVYAGTLGYSYDLSCVFDAMEILKNKGVNNLKFIVMGDGPLKKKFEDYAESKKVNTLFTGRLPYNEMVGILGVCDIAVNPIRKGAAASIINKHGDYAAAGLPVINTQECMEYRNLVDDYKMGLNCNNNDAIDIGEKLMTLLKDSELRNRMGRNSRELAEQKFDRHKTYLEIIKS